MSKDVTQCLDDLLTEIQGKNKTKNYLADCYALNKAKVVVDTIAVAKFLKELDFYQNDAGADKNFSLYRNGVLFKGISRSDIYSFIFDCFKLFDENFKSKSDIPHKLNIELNKHIKKETHVVGILPKCSLKEYRDPKDKTRVFFKNLIAVVEANNIKTETYKEFSKRGEYINSKKIIQFNYNHQKAKPDNSDFKKVVDKITNNQKHRLSLISVIGFFMNSFKSKKEPIIFILSDENSLIQNNNNGQSFKSEGVEAAIQYAVGCFFFENAQNFNKNFPFQNIKPEHDLFIFGDAPKDFNLKILYEAKRGIDVELKARSKADQFIPFEYSPKLLVDTNFRLGTNSSSDKGRIFRMTINNYFDADYTPNDEFDKEFFTDWGKTEWNDFYGFMLNCAATYLKNGLVKYTNERLKKMEFANHTSPEFVEFTDSELKLNEWYFLSIIAARVMPNTYNQSKVKASKIIKSWLQHYCNDNNLVFTSKTGSSNKIVFKVSETNLFNKTRQND